MAAEGVRARDFLGAGQLRAALNRAKYSHLVDSDDTSEEKQAGTFPRKSDLPGTMSNNGKDRSCLILGADQSHQVDATKAEARDRRESNSSYAEEDHPSVTGKRLPESDFNYQELDDEFGSRPVDPTAPLVLTLKQNSTEVSPSQTFNVNADRIVGHEYGVKPLLDDDELQESYSGQTQGSSSSKSDNGGLCKMHNFGGDNAGMTNQGLAACVNPVTEKDQASVASEPAKADVVDSAAMTTSSSSVLSPDIDSSFDVFSAAPFRPRSAKRATPQQVQASGTSSVASAQTSDVFESAPFRLKPSKQTIVTSPGSVHLHNSQDIFGSAPFSPPASTITPGSTCPSSSTVSPSMEDIMYIKTPDEAQPGSLPSTMQGHGVSGGSLQQQQQMLGGAVPVRSESWQKAVPGGGAGGSGTSFDFGIANLQESHPGSKYPHASVPYSEPAISTAADDPFGAVPWNKALKRSVKKNRVASGIPTSSPASCLQSTQGQTIAEGHHAGYATGAGKVKHADQSYLNTPSDMARGHQTQGIKAIQGQADIQSLGSHPPQNHPQGAISVPSSSNQVTRSAEMITAMRPGDLPMPTAVGTMQFAASGAVHSNVHQQQHQKQTLNFNSTGGDESQQPDWEAMRSNFQVDGGSYQRLRTKTDPSPSSSSHHYSSKRSSRDVSTAAFANMSFNDEDELDATLSRESPMSTSSTAPLRLSPAMSTGTSKGKPSSPAGFGSAESGRTVVVAAAQSAGYDTGTWPRKHRRNQAKAEPFSVSKKL